MWFDSDLTLVFMLPLPLLDAIGKATNLGKRIAQIDDHCNIRTQTESVKYKHFIYYSVIFNRRDLLNRIIQHK